MNIDQENERNQSYIETLGKELFEKIQNSKVLVVGAGGIGCELLKNLVLSGFKNIEIIDLDTIDLSNLNRQFLFRKQHIGMSKAKIARETVLKYNPNVNIIAHHGDIKTTDFGPQFFKRFDLVMNALDNLSARRHVNRVCLSVDVPLIESGTAGYLGQVTVIKKGETECFECQPTATPKEYAVCTIRSNPSAPIHCIVWAKMLFGRLFGVADESNAVTDMDDNLVQGDPEKPETVVRDTQLATEKAKGYKQWVFHKIFYTDIDKLSRMKEMWKDKSPPKPLLLDSQLNNGDNSNNTTTTTNGESNHQLKDQKLWSLHENITMFLECLDRLKERNEKDGSLTWDKDDEWSMNFVTAASNIRSSIFGIPMKSKFDVKSMAGNIIPAIATTNAVIGGLIVMEAIKVIDGRLKQCNSTYLFKLPSRKRLLLTSTLDKPNPNCYVCSPQNISLKVNTQKTTVLQLVNDILKKNLSFSQPILTVGNDILYEGGDEDLSTEEIEMRKNNEKKVMADYRLSDQVLLKVEDYIQDFQVSILICHSDEMKEQGSGSIKKEEEDKWFQIIGKAEPSAPVQTQPVQSIANPSATSTIMDTDDIEIVEQISTDASTYSKTTTSVSASKKRKEMDQPSEDIEVSKKLKQHNE
ncbi:sumo-activating enzyme subunit 2 [Tieghemostelium lacteum]|uniref:SUMO-activating enzyme subunit n=1 Tax=Tieghemostelium lacteum TaxID=361077 RepID=A0A151ZIN4_TIELA|nr:sumo-activating enzyme subunit 2 [Tieghemostelium lacteum]|eukprot:KYQ93777.1 sumo-activating enzyme subunit 2 [Tieghemostelium lacteum]